MGNDFVYKNSELLERIAKEIVEKQRADETVFSLYSMFCTFLDFAQDPDFIQLEKIQDILFTDRAYIKSVFYFGNGATPPSNLHEYMLPVKSYFDKNGIKLVKPLEAYEIAQMEKPAIKKHETQINEAVTFVKEVIGNLSAEAKTALINSNQLTDMFIPGLLLILGEATPDQYANMIVVAKIGDSIDYTFPKLHMYRSEITTHRKSAETINEFIALTR